MAHATYVTYLSKRKRGKEKEREREEEKERGREREKDIHPITQVDFQGANEVY